MVPIEILVTMLSLTEEEKKGEICLTLHELLYNARHEPSNERKMS